MAGMVVLERESLLPKLRARVLAALDNPSCSDVELRVAKEAMRTIHRIYQAEPERYRDWEEAEEDLE